MRLKFSKLISYALIFLSILNATQGQKSQLESIFDELSIVNRIINAVALQKSAIGGNVKARAVIIELFKLRPDKFGELVQLDTENVLKVIREFSGKSDARLKAPPFIASSSVEDSETANRAIVDGMNNVENMRWLVQLNMTEIWNFRNPSMDIDKFLPCDHRILKSIADFHAHFDVMNRVQLYSDLKRNLNKAAVCLQKLGSFKMPEKTTDSVLLNSLRAIKGMSIMKEGIKRNIEAATLFKNFHDLIGSLNTEYDNLKNIWSPGAASQKLANETFTSILAAQNSVFDPSTTTIAHLTSGFQKGAADIAKVVDDVKSEWFKEKIARGKDAELLATSLTPISESAKTLEKLENSWDAMQDLYDDNRIILSEACQHLEKVAIFQQNPVNKSVLQNSHATLGTCKNDSAVFLTLNGTMDGKFNDYAYKPNNLLAGISRVNATRTQIIEKIDAQVIAAAFLRLETVIPDGLTDKTVDAENAKIRKHEAFIMAQTAFQHISKFYEAEAAVDGAFSVLKFDGTEHTEVPSEEVQKVMNSTDIEKMSTCFKNNNFNHQDVGRMVAFVQGVSKLFDPNTYNITVTYLEMLAKFQKDLKDQETGMVSLRVNLEKQISMNVSNPVLLLNDSLGLSNHFGAGMEVLEQMIQVQKENKTLEGPITYQPDVLAEIKRLDNKSFWQDPGSSIRSLLAGIGQLETAAASARLGKKQLMDIRSVFLAAEKVPGIDNFKDRIVPLPDRLRPRSSQPAFQTAIENLEQLSDWDLDFVKHKKTLNSAYLSLESISWYFDDIFGFTRSQSNSNNNQSQTIQHVEVHVTEPYLSFLTLLGMSLGLILFIFLVAFVAYGFTKNGRTKYRNFYLYYFPNQKEFEKRWRYSLFMDRLDGKNALLDASREVNPINTRNILNKGAYINVYNAHGNTALHMVTKRGYHEIVELLIKNGADRGAKNASNKIPEQMIAKNLSDLPQDVIADLKKVEEVYEKHRKKKYRIRVPQEFPSHLFHVYIEPRTDDTLTNSFMDKFKSIATNEPLPTATHCVVKTNADGHLETDDLNLLMWIFNGVIIVKENWMKACLDDPKAIYEDSKYLVEHVKYKGVVYKNCVLPWSQAMAKGTMPYLYGVYFVVCRYEYDNLAIIHDLIATLGGNSPQTFPIKENFELGSRPYLHTNLGPLFLLHDGQMDLTAYKNDPDNMYTLFTEEEFIAFLLKREVHQDTSDDPIPVVLDNEPIY